MTDVDFNKEDIKRIANILIQELYRETKGDEWNHLDIEDFIKKLPSETKEIMNNDAFKNNILQTLVAEGFIIYAKGPIHRIGITYKGKNYLGKVPSFPTKIPGA